MRLIDADKLLEIFEVLDIHNLDNKVYVSNVVYAIKTAPTVHEADSCIVKYKRDIKLMVNYIITLVMKFQKKFTQKAGEQE